MCGRWRISPACLNRNGGSIRLCRIMRNLFVAVSVALLLLAVVVFAWAQSQPPLPRPAKSTEIEQKQTNASKNNTATDKSTTNDSPIFIPATPSEDTHSKTD